MTRLALFSLLLALAGCVSVVPRSPNTGLVSELGLEETQKEVMVISARARDPQISEVEFNDVGFVYSYSALAPMTLIPTQGKHSVIWQNMTRLDLYENNKVFVIGQGDRVTSQILFNDMSDAERWQDLVMSLQAHALGR